MKKFANKIASAVCVALGIFFPFAQVSASEMADWYFSNAGNSWALTPECQFQSTDQNDVFILPSFSLSGSMAYKITNSAWSEYYGWADNGSITETGIAYPLGAMSDGNGWFALDAGTYDITFDRGAKTITFRLSENQDEVDEGNNWYLTGTFNNWSLELKFEQDTDNENLFILEDVRITDAAISDGYWNFEVSSEGWGAQYIFTDDFSTLGIDYTFVKRYDDLVAYSSLPADTYRFTWNKKAHTLKIEKDMASGIADITADIDEAEAEYYTISGAKTASKNLSKGIYIKKYGNKVKKIIR